MSIEEHPGVEIEAIASGVPEAQGEAAPLDAEQHIAKLLRKQKRKRELDKEVAIAVGYSVSYLKELDVYFLVRPRMSMMIALGGLATIHGQGPKQRLPGRYMHLIGRTAEDAWDWVPHFTTNPIHYEALCLHVQRSLHLKPSCTRTAAIKGCQDIIKQMRARSGRKSP